MVTETEQQPDPETQRRIDQRRLALEDTTLERDVRERMFERMRELEEGEEDA